MLTGQLELTNEQTSPLFRLMWIHNATEPARRHYDNNICAFHIGNGFILSVAHNIKTEALIFKSIDNAIFTADILPHLNPTQTQLFNQCYPLDPQTNKRYINIINQADVQTVVDTLKQINFDTRWLTLTQRNICNPFLIIQFKNNQFYNDPTLTGHFNGNTYFHEPAINRHTFLVEVELVDAYYNEDIALYKIVNTHQDIISRLPSIEVDFSLLDDNQPNFYCLQSSPNSEVGKLINKAQIEGYLEHFGLFPDRIGGNYTFEGTRYLIKGYFRFGSSGAPYVFFDIENNKFKVNAIQSEACPVQLSIDNKRDGNFQYVNAIASPLNIIETRLQPHLTPATV
ncbi:hypothetical protein [Flavobacterium macacae]|uniref:Uncharacterized protein n=1 Tax=Flavobacterium macacae TaxID=2488993 RepID=A0A3P3W3Q5_9FLAO|nr:hypothetical protein [Flavobacterium macacae]RRJ89731.1 hypothetical protein EG849_12010 [Flavobacterium macacae]